MSPTAKKKSIRSEPIICDVITPVKQYNWNQGIQPHQGSVSIDLKNAKDVNNIKNLIFDAVDYCKVKLPYRFALSSSEIIYRNKHIEAVRVAGFYLSGIDSIKVEAQLSSWTTESPPETFLDDDGEIVMSEEFSRQCYFVAYRAQKEFHIAWNLAENYDVYQNPQNYSGIQWHTVDFSK